MTRTTSDTGELVPLWPLVVLVTTSLSPSLTSQLKPSVGLKTTISPTPVPQGLEPLTVKVITNLAPQGQAKLTALVSPAHEAVLPGAPEPLNTPLFSEIAHQTIAVPTINMPSPEQGVPTTTGNMPRNNMKLSGWTAELLVQSKHL